jgi:hypothetical protein
MANLDLFERMSIAIAKPETKTDHTQILSPVAPGGIGLAIDPRLDGRAKTVAARLAREFPAEGLEPEQRAQLNMAVKLAGKAAEDSEFYADRADKVSGSMARIHTANVRHLGNAMQHDLKFKAADVTHMGNIESWQAATLSLVEKAREKHAGIQLLQMAL